ncbi:MAG: hypothetical protein DRQ62_12800 [Gammaproteobacteria bacterium]|nr:MAG: hypothetical protein DRQ62_12800 [Gammaproteobacteria bacterium]
MKIVYEISGVEESRLTFIEILSAEFMSRTGVGVYVYLTPMDVNNLFRVYLTHSKTISIFVREYVRHYSNDNNIY